MKQANYTVEAVFVMSICVWVLLALFYASFYIHDRVIIGSVTNGQIQRHFQETEAKVSEEWKKELKENLSGRLFLIKINKVEAKKQLATVNVKVFYRLPISVKNIKTLFTDKKAEEAFATTKKQIRPVEYKWDYRALKEKGTK